MKYTTAFSRQIPTMALFLVALLSLDACTNQRALPPCPNIFAIADARQVDHYRLGFGRDLTDVEYSVRLDGWKGSCGYKPRGEDWDVNIDLEVAFTVKRGPANTTGTADFEYFAAIPAFFPKEEGKETIPVAVKFPEGVSTVKPISGPIYLTFPVRADDVIDNYNVYLGLQLLPDELERNRRSN